MPVDFYTLSVIRKEELAKDTFSFTFSTEGNNFSFLPGQYVTVKIGNETRDFSIVSSPTDKDMLMIVTKRGKSDFKRRLLEKEEADVVEVSAPSGGFILDTKDDTPQVFIAGGIGITPFYSMLMYAFDKKIERPLILFVSFSRAEDVIFHKDLLSIQKKRSNIQVIYTLSSPVTGWHGERGRINQVLLRKYIPDIASPTYYLVGKVEMVDDMYNMLLTMEVPQDKIKIEYFTGY